MPTPGIHLLGKHELGAFSGTDPTLRTGSITWNKTKPLASSTNDLSPLFPSRLQPHWPPCHSSVPPGTLLPSPKPSPLCGLLFLIQVSLQMMLLDHLWSKDGPSLTIPFQITPHTRKCQGPMNMFTILTVVMVSQAHMCQVLPNCTFTYVWLIV